MLPNNTVTEDGPRTDYLRGDAERTSLLVDYEMGGVAVGDASQGLSTHLWTFRADPSGVLLSREGAAEQRIFTVGGINELAGTFDQNMQPVLAYQLANGQTHIRWYDSVAQQFTVTVFAGMRNPRLSLDDKRPSMSNTSDVIFAYISAEDALCYRQQRDRYTVERVLLSNVDPTVKLRNIGMTANLRLRFDIA